MDKKLLGATLLLLSQLMFADIAFAQGGPKENVSGTVTDISGETLPGAVITISGATAGAVKVSTMADIDGKYSIECAIGDVIVFQYGQPDCPDQQGRCPDGQIVVICTNFKINICILYKLGLYLLR